MPGSQGQDEEGVVGEFIQGIIDVVLGYLVAVKSDNVGFAETAFQKIIKYADKRLGIRP